MSKCLIHGRELTLLFTSARCDECDGLIEKPKSGLVVSLGGGSIKAVTWGIRAVAYYAPDLTALMPAISKHCYVSLGSLDTVEVTLSDTIVSLDCIRYGVPCAAIYLELPPPNNPCHYAGRLIS